jgi:hypothetical protein
MNPSPRRVPRFGVVHFQIWTIGCALGFLTYHALTYDLNPQFRPLGLAYNLVMGMSLGTILTGVSLLHFRRWRGDQPSPLLPGHWLLVFGLAAALVDGVAIVLYRFIKSPLLNPPMAYWTPFRIAWGPSFPEIVEHTVGWGLGAVLSMAFGWSLRRRLPWPWLVVFLGFFLASATLAGGSILAIVEAHRAGSSGVLFSWCRRSVHVYAGSILVCAFAILAAASYALRRRCRTDGLHWAGLTVWLAIAAIQFINYYFIIFVFI